MEMDAAFRRFLDDISDCFVQRDFGGWEARTRRPFTMITRQGPVYLTTRADLKQNFEYYLEAIKIMRVDTIYRSPMSLDETGDNTLIGTYETQLLCHGQRATDPYISSALIHVEGDVWRMSSIMGARGHHDETGHRPRHWET